MGSRKLHGEDNMKYPNLKKWKYNPKLEGLLFFAQVVEELLFDYTIDTYKIPAMNLHILCRELCQTIDDIESGVIRKGAIRPIIEELSDSLNKDVTAIHLFREVLNELLSHLNRNDSIGEIKVRAELVRNKLEKEYLAETIRLLKESVVDGKRKENIISLTKTLLTEWVNFGYSPEYIYFESLRFFFDGRYPSIIDDVSLIDDYFKYFTPKELDVNMIYRVSENFQELKEFAGEYDMEIQSDAPSIKFARPSTRVSNFLAKNESFPLFLVMKNIKAYDFFAAREEGDVRIQLIDSLARYHVHRKNFNWSDEVLVYSQDGRSFGVHKKPVPPTLKRPEEDIRNISNLIKKTLLTVTSDNLDKESLSRFMRAFLRHDMAIKSTTPESQLLEFWAAIEVLFSTYEDGEDKILQIAKGIIPFETAEHAAKIGADLFSSIKNSGISDALRIIKEVEEGSNEIEKCLALVAIQDNEDKRDKLYKSLGDHVLLKNRVFYIKNRLSSADMIRNTIGAHDKRVYWQIQRIYRARNMIIHSGKSLPSIKILVENLHSYLDRVLDLLIEEVSLLGYSISVDQICEKLKLEHDAHLKLLEKANNEICTRENYKLLLFGH